MNNIIFSSQNENNFNFLKNVQRDFFLILNVTKLIVSILVFFSPYQDLNPRLLTSQLFNLLVQTN